jgi:hypothetical protein
MPSMTPEESTFWNYVHEYVLQHFRYSVISLTLDTNGTCYAIRLNRLGAPVAEARTFTVFADQLRDCAQRGQLPDGLMKSFANDLGDPRLINSGFRGH